MIENSKLSRIKLSNFKNVTNGEVNFINKRKVSNIIGFYGQNGSGKTAVVEAIEIFTKLASGQELDNDVLNLIEYGKNHLEVELEFEFNLNSRKSETEEMDDNGFKYIYSFKIEKSKISNKSEVEQLNEEVKGDKETFKPVVANEKIYVKDKINDKRLRNPISIDLSDNQDFLKIKPKVSAISNINYKTDFLLSYKLARGKSTSFLFLKETLNTFETMIKSEKVNVSQKEIIKEIYVSLNIFKDISKRITVVSNNKNAYVLSNFMLPLSLYLEDEERNIIGNIEFSLPIKGSSNVSEIAYDLGKGVLASINLVLPLIIPGLEIHIKELGEEIDDDGDKVFRIALLSKRGNTVLPFSSESDGIKKIVYMLAGIIQIFNHKGNILVIDEIDSGIFEFLLGEILTIISDNAKGQMIFTSHNLRALEVLDYTNIVFTTTNPESRYLRPKNIKESHNLRNAYIRGLQVDNFEETLYKSANTSKVKLGLMKSKKEIETVNKRIFDKIIK